MQCRSMYRDPSCVVVSWLVLGVRHGIGMGNWECVPIPGYELCGSELVGPWNRHGKLGMRPHSRIRAVW